MQATKKKIIVGINIEIDTWTWGFTLGLTVVTVIHVVMFLFRSLGQII